MSQYTKLLTMRDINLSDMCQFLSQIVRLPIFLKKSNKSGPNVCKDEGVRRKRQALGLNNVGTGFVSMTEFDAFIIRY